MIEYFPWRIYIVEGFLEFRTISKLLKLDSFYSVEQYKMIRMVEEDYFETVALFVCSLKNILLYIFTCDHSIWIFNFKSASKLHTAKFQQKFLIFRSDILPSSVYLTFIYFRVVHTTDTATISRMSSFTRTISSRYAFLKFKFEFNPNYTITIFN